tara:strand:- start:14858 stop:15859 length:1002 start_codon:yes stop_codon:yes gene_type:complete
VLIQHGARYLNYTLPAGIDYFFKFHGVPIFFAISGFLVAISWVNSSFDINKYLVSRSLRIFPALWCSTILSFLLISSLGKIKFAISLKGLLWFFCQSTFFPFWNPSELRDFGIGVLNGSLWTIPVELQFYFLIPIIFIAYIYLKNKTGNYIWFLLLGIIIVLSILSQVLIPPVPPGDGSIPREGPLWIKLFYVSIFPYLSQFLMGTILILPYIYLGQKKSSAIFLGIGILMFIAGNNISPNSLIYNFASPVCIALIVIGIGLFPSPLRLPFDISYGLYLYHGLVINLLTVTTNYNNISTLILYLSITTFLAFLSWYIIESRALKLKSYFLSRI